MFLPQGLSGQSKAANTLFKMQIELSLTNSCLYKLLEVSGTGMRGGVRTLKLGPCSITEEERAGESWHTFKKTPAACFMLLF